MLEIYKKNKDIKNLERICGRIEPTANLVKENEEDFKVNSLIREKYSLSQELCLHRKKIIGIVDESEWNEYVAFVEECIERARGF